MRNPDPGYLLPDGEAYTDDFACQLIFIPRKDEYYKAMLGAILYMGTWVAWQRDTDKRGKDAAQAWREANELTMECWRMTCMDDITERMDIIIDLLANQPGCCDTTTIGPVIITTTIIIPGVGDDPTHWGETEVADWSEWLEYICYHAHRYVDILIEGARGLDVAVQLGSYTVEFLSLLAQLQRFTYKGYPINLAEIMEIYQGFKDAVDLVSEFDGLADRFEAARQEIVCSFIQGSSLSDAVEAAVDNEILWTLFYMWTDYASVQAMIYEGSFDGVGYLPAIKRDDCECVEDPQFEYTWDTDRQGWTLGGQMAQAWNAVHAALQGAPTAQSTWKWGGGQTGDQIAARFSLDTPVIVKRVKYRIWFETNGAGTGITFRHRIGVKEAGPTHYTDIIDAAAVGWEEWHEISFEFPSPLTLDNNSSALLNGGYVSGGPAGQRIIIDNLRCYPD